MSSKVSMTRGLVAAATLVLIFCFNNCQPVGNPNELSSASNIDDGGTNGNNNPQNPQLPEAQLFYETQVKPVFRQQCASCHAEPRLVQPPNVAGPLSLYNYTAARQLLANGASSTTNLLISKMQNLTAHAGGNRCASAGLAGLPCSIVVQWWQREFPSSPAGTAGKVTFISEVGRVTGWAIDPANPTQRISVYFYGDGPIGQGVRLGEAVANLAGDGAQNGSYFSYELPANFRNNMPHNLYVYAGAEDANNLIPGTPINYAAYSPTNDGRQFFMANVRPLMNACGNCHGTDYDNMWARLLTPTPFQGGTATTTQLILKASGNNHPGGNHCPGGLNAGLCAQIQAWWAVEFQ